MSTIRPRSALGILAVATFVAACNNDNTSSLTPTGSALPAPTSLVYQIQLGEYIGSTTDSLIDPGVVLSWLPGGGTDSSLVNDFVVYGSDDTTSASNWVRRAITTSLSFHDAFQPQEAYYVTSQDGNGDESAPSSTVTINPADTVETPTGITGTAFDAAVTLGWDPNSITGPNGSHFDYYRVYSDSLANNSCVSGFEVLEGTSVSDAFVITNLTNGSDRCYWVSAVTKTGHESSFSAVVELTPSSGAPPFTAARIPANATIISHHPVALFKHVMRH